MAADRQNSLALIVGTTPYHRRSARSDLDIALAAAALEFRLEVYFLGSAVLQLAAQRDAAPAMLPSGYRAWASLPDLCGADLFAEEVWLGYCVRRNLELILPVEALSPGDLRRAWRGCRHAWVL